MKQQEKPSMSDRIDTMIKADRTRQVLNKGEDDEFTIEGYVMVKPMFVLAIILCVITGGIFALVFYWMQHWLLKMTHKRCPLSMATRMLIMAKYDVKDVTAVYMLDAVSKRSTKASSKNTESTEKLQTISYPVDPNWAAKYAAQNSDTRDASLIGTLPLKIRHFKFQELVYYWDPERTEFERLWGLDKGSPSGLFYSLQGLSDDEQSKRRYIHGPNFIQVKITPIIVLLVQEVLSPFYIFQIFSVCLWIYEKYYIYAGCIIGLSLMSIVITLVQTRKMQSALREKVDSAMLVNVYRGEAGFAEIHSDLLVPGDVIEIPRGGCMLQCDAVLLTGNVIVNESMLTGESVPVIKTPLPNPYVAGQPDIPFNIKEHSRHTLFCGTKVLQARYLDGQWVRAVVLRTGFSTMKGELVRSILYPKPVDFKFNRHALGYVGVLALIAVLTFIYTGIVLKMIHDKDTEYVILKGLDLVTIAVPPALPAAMTFGVMFAQFRLRKKKIFCISPGCINIAGCISICVFDKTGTLTEDGLDMSEVIPTESDHFLPAVSERSGLKSDEIVAGMAACHSLTRIDNELSGDPLDLKMFLWTGWELEEGQERPEGLRFDVPAPAVVFPKDNQAKAVGIVRQLPFASKLQRMSVIVRILGDSGFTMFTKGAPEMVISMSTSGVPTDFAETLERYTSKGLRVVALATRRLEMSFVDVERATREDLESNLRFLGLIVMENRLKKDTTAAIGSLSAAKLRLIMCTGDNVQTGVSVARECGILKAGQQVFLLENEGDVVTMKEVKTSGAAKLQATSTILEMQEPYTYACTGGAFDIIKRNHPTAFQKLCLGGAVFARMSPDQKQQLVEAIQALGFYVSMCGDGANDCGALKAAHMGIALTETEASVASPFTSKDPQITCVHTTIREGRAAMVTSFGVFKYMAAYSLTQLCSALILYWLGITLTDLEFLLEDLFIITILVLLAGNTHACKELASYPPANSLLHARPILSLVAQTGLVIAGQAIAFHSVKLMPGYLSPDDQEEIATQYNTNGTVPAFSYIPEGFDPRSEFYSGYSENVNFENTAVFDVSIFMLITQAFIFAKGPPFRRVILTNWIFMVYLGLVLAMCVWIVVYPVDGLIRSFELVPIAPQWNYRWIFVAIGFGHCLLSLLVEDGIIENRLWNKVCACCVQNDEVKEVPILRKQMEQNGPALDPSFREPGSRDRPRDQQQQQRRPLSGGGPKTNAGFTQDGVTLVSYTPSTTPTPHA